MDPGYTKWRGTLLQELIHPLMQITKRDHDLELISPLEFRRRLDFCTRNLNTAKKCIRGGFTPIEDFIRQQATSPRPAQRVSHFSIQNYGGEQLINEIRYSSMHFLTRSLNAQPEPVALAVTDDLA